MQTETAARMAENEARFRAANEEIRESADELEFGEPIPFICECGEPACREILRLSARDYEAVRSEATHFFVVPGHEQVAGSAGRVVSRQTEYVVVEKVGEAAEVARELDPRDDE
jgi:hypothetical protein